MRVFVVKKYRKTLKWMRWCPAVFACIWLNKMICLVQEIWRLDLTSLGVVLVLS